MREVYKQINHELILSNQEYKKNISLLQQEIIYLNGKLMEEHEKGTNIDRLQYTIPKLSGFTVAKLKAHCVKLLTKSFAQLVEAVDPENDILYLLRAAGNDNDKSKKRSYSPKARRRNINSTSFYKENNSNNESPIKKLIQNIDLVNTNICSPTHNTDNNFFDGKLFYIKKLFKVHSTNSF